LVATDYLESDDETGKAGVLDNLPRIDYTSGSAQLLIEPSRTNLLEHSEYFADVYFGKFNVDVDASDILSPEGKSNSYKVTETTSNSQHAINVSNRPTLTAGSHTHSCFVKANGVNDIVFYNNGTSGAAGVNFDLSSESYSNLVNSATGASIESYGDGWYRISMTFTAVVGTTGPTIYLRTLGSYAGDGVSGIYVYGMQTEAGSYATSYIPTYGASDTRNNDYMSLLATNFYSTTSYTYFLDINLPNDVGTTIPLWKDNDYLASNGGFQVRKTTNTGSFVGITTHDGSSYIGLSTDVLTGRLKFAIIYDNGQVSVYYNGVQSGSAISVTGWDQSTNHFKFGEGGVGLYEPNQFSYFPTALTPQEAIALTTL
jgi:hypothetical protein